MAERTAARSISAFDRQREDAGQSRDGAATVPKGGYGMRKLAAANVIALMLAAGAVGYFVGPPIAGAVASVVKIGSGSTSSQLKIVKGAANVSVPGVVFTENNGDAVILSGSASATACTSFWVLDAVVVDSPSATTTVSITASGTPVWSGTAAAGGHLDDTFDGGVFSTKAPLAVAETGSGTWYLYGFCGSGNAVKIAGGASIQRP